MKTTTSERAVVRTDADNGNIVIFFPDRWTIKGTGSPGLMRAWSELSGHCHVGRAYYDQCRPTDAGFGAHALTRYIVTYDRDVTDKTLRLVTCTRRTDWVC